MSTDLPKTEMNVVIKLSNWLRNYSRFISLNDPDKSTDIWLVIAISALLGALYGIFIDPFWSEPVDFGQAWAGLVPYNKSPWGTAIFAQPSLQIIIPALLLLVGFKIWTLCLAATATFCAISFSAVAAASFAFSRNKIVSIFIPLLLLVYQFSQAHGYPVTYPVMYWQFGQTGQYLALLGLSLLACQRPKTAGLIGGVLGGVHAVWCLCFVVGAFPIAFFLQKKCFKALSFSFLISLILSLGILYFGSLAMPHKAAYAPPYVPEKLQNDVQKTISEKTTISDNKESENANDHPVETAKFLSASPIIPDKNNQRYHLTKKNRGIFIGHNVTFSTENSPIIAGLYFFSAEIAFAGICLFFYFMQRGTRGKTKFSYGNHLLAMISIPVILAIILQIVEEIDPFFYVFGLIDGRIPGLILRAIFNRWLNLTTIIIPIFIISSLAILVRDKKNWIAAAGFILIIGLAVTKRFDHRHLLLLAMFLLSLAFMQVLYYKFKKQINLLLNINGNEPVAIVLMAIVVYMFFDFSALTGKAFTQRKVLGSDAIDPLIAVAKADSGPILLGSGVVGTNGFNPQLRTERPIVVPSQLEVYDSATNNIIQVYCLTDLSISFGQFYTNVQSCFEQRSIKEWDVIKRETQATALIVPENWKLQIPPTITAGGFAYYRLQDV